LYLPSRSTNFELLLLVTLTLLRPRALSSTNTRGTSASMTNLAVLSG
jgi:hypothetical protein